MNRRKFLQLSAAGLAFSVIGAPAAVLDGQKKRVGLIGSGWYGKCDVLRLLQVAPVEVVSLCDPDRKMLEAAGELMAARQPSKKTPRLYGDYREMLKEKDLDIVFIGTPDHWHALPMIEAVKAGADVYLQKPIGVDVVEGQAMLAAARKYGKVVQVGTQRRSTPHLIEARELIREGKLGNIAHVEICCYWPMRTRDNPPDTVAPDYLDWEMWNGPAPKRAYNRLYHPRGWWGFMEFSNGIVGDMCIHLLDAVRWMMDLGWPTSVSSTGGIMMHKNSKANISDTQIATFDFPEVKVVWTHRTWGDALDPKYTWGIVFYGEKATLKASVFSYDFLPREGTAVHKDVAYELEQFPEDKTEKDLEKHVAPALRAHMKDFMQAIASRGKPVADIEQGHISTTACILANMSMNLGRSLKWDPSKHQVVGDDEANRLLRRPYREPWVHPEPDKV